MANTLKFNASSIDVMHQRSMMESLASRLKVAQLARNAQLIEKLEQEQQQYAAKLKVQTRLQFLESCLNAIKQGASQVFGNGSTLRVCEFSCGSDRWLYAFDPITEEFRYADSEVELEGLMGTTHKR